MSSIYFHEPFFSLNDFQRLFDVFDDQRSPSRQVARRSGDDNGTQQRTLTRGFQPRMDIHESPESNLVTATVELPGLKKEDVSIDVQGGRLVVSGEQTQSNEVNENGYVLRERSSGRFWRALPLPAGTQPTDIKASMENGVLTVTFPKTSPEQTPQKITIA